MTDKKNSIATIIPFYNGSKYIKDALDSLENEDLVSDEVIIVDDGSPDAEDVVRMKAIASCSSLNIKILRQENTGQGGARNRGVQAANSKYITFLDQDDMVLAVKNRVLLKAIEKRLKCDPECAYATADAIHVNNLSLTVRNHILAGNRTNNKMDVLDFIRADVFQLPGATLFLREVFSRVGGFDSRLAGYEDDDLFVRIYRHGFSGLAINDEVLKWRINIESTSYSQRMQDSRLIYALKLLQEYPDDFFQRRFYSSFIQQRFRPLFMSDIRRSALAYLISPAPSTLSTLRHAVSIARQFNAAVALQRKSISYSSMSTSSEMIAYLTAPGYFSPLRLKGLMMLRVSGLFLLHPVLSLRIVASLLMIWLRSR